jgi:hypothetical protein
MATPFVIFALPRCRTKWIATFLSYGDWHCGHDEIRHCRSLDDVRSWLAQPCTGTIETACSAFWRLLPPDVRVVTLRRPVAEVVASLHRGGLVFDEPGMTRFLERAERKLDQIERRVPNVLALTFADLGHEAGCARVFEHCLGLPHDHGWWAAWHPVNIQVNLPHLVRYFTAHAPQLTKLAQTAKHRILRGMVCNTELDGVTFQCEPFRSFYRDAQPLFAEHLVQTGQAPDDHARKNLALFEALDDRGALHVFTSRSNGRMFSYLVSVIAPSLDDPHELLAEQTIFFADPSWPGLGMKTQRAAIADLRARGVNRALMRAGHRGSGPRLGTMFRRLGAEPFGSLYSLPLEA